MYVGLENSQRISVGCVSAAFVRGENSESDREVPDNSWSRLNPYQRHGSRCCGWCGLSQILGVWCAVFVRRLRTLGFGVGFRVVTLTGAGIFELLVSCNVRRFFWLVNEGSGDVEQVSGGHVCRRFEDKSGGACLLLKLSCIED